MTTVITLPVPEAEELAAASGAPRPLTVHRIQTSGAAAAVAPPLKFRPRPEVPEVPEVPDAGAAASAAAAEPCGHWRSDPEDDARVNAIARSVTQAALEALGGTRPLQQLARWLDPPSYERLQLRAALVHSREQAAAGRGGKAVAPVLLHRQVLIRCCRVCPVSEGVYEASVVAAEQDKVRAAALRVELRRGLWKVTALEIG